MLGDCHIHLALDGADFHKAALRHGPKPADAAIRQALQTYRALGVCFLRDGGDAWGVCSRAAELAPEYGIDYRHPCFPIYRTGRYGRFLGRGYASLDEYRQLVAQVRARGGDFIKLMLSGIMDFSCFGRLSCESLPADEIRQLIHIAHEEGFAVMAHVNGDDAVSAAIAAGADSVEHGNFMSRETLCQLAESPCVWVPTLAPVGNLSGCGRFDDRVLSRLLAAQTAAVRRAASLGARIALGSDAGAFRVPHGAGVRDEYALLQKAAIPDLDAVLAAGQAQIQKIFSVS